MYYINAKRDTQHIDEIGSHKFSAACSDNTGNTCKGRRLVSTNHPHILNLQDADHELSLTINEICSLDFFKPVSSPGLKTMIA